MIEVPKALGALKLYRLGIDGESSQWDLSTCLTFPYSLIGETEFDEIVTKTGLSCTVPDGERFSMFLTINYELRRTIGTVPTADALVALLELKGIATSDGDSMHRLRLFSTDCLGSVELPFFLAFKEHGSPLSRERLEDICVDQYGVHPTSFWIYLSYSPVVIKLAPGVYALAGADVTPGAVEDVRLRTKTAQTPSEHGWTQKGELWCVTQLDRNNVRSGNRFIPAYVARLTNGDWACSVAGELAAGVVTVEQGLARGVALAFSLAGAENGDLARFTFDLQRRSVEVRVGGSELNEDAAVGPDYFEEAEDETELDLDDDPPATSN